MPPPSNVSLGPLTRAIRAEARWAQTSEFPSNQAWADDVERVLNFLVWHGVFGRFLPRLRGRERERDAALSETRTGFFFGRNGFRITAWEPEVVPNRPGDLEIQWCDTDRIFVEVKGPTWEGELTDDERAAGRLLQPKYVNAEARAVDPIERVVFGVDKAVPKFAADRINLVVIVDDLFRSALEVPRVLLQGRLDRLFSNDSYRIVGGIFMLRVVKYSSEEAVAYENFFIPNPNAQHALPEAVRLGLLAGNETPVGPRGSR